jgi:CysZ protein
LKRFFAGAGYPFRGLAFLARRRALWVWLAAPIVLHAVLLVLTLAAFLWFRQDLLDALLPSAWTGWTSTLAGWGLQAAALLLGVLASVLIGNVLASPFLDALAVRVLAAAGEILPPPPSALASIGGAAANQALQVLILGVVQSGLLALWITPLGILHPFLSAAASILFLAQESLDPALDTRDLSPFARLGWIFRHRASVAGFGAALALLLAVPFVGVLLLPCAVAGASLLVKDLEGRGDSAATPGAARGL